MKTTSDQNLEKKSPLAHESAHQAGFQFDYDDAPESTSIVQLKEKYDLFVDGKFTPSKSKETLDSINPATGEVLAKISVAGDEDVDKAVESANKAFQKSWGQITPSERSRYLFRIARMIQERAREFAVLETLDNGKPIKETRDVDIPLVAAHFFYYAGWADKLDYLVPGRKVKPIGVAAQVIPWNFPLLMAAWKIAPALAAGNTVVIKPAETTSLSLLLLAEVIQDSGLPPGVVNIVTGAGATGAALVSHKDVQKVAFTGSTEVGKKISQAVIGQNKKLTLELGGKSAHLIFEDAAIDQAIEGVVSGIYFNQGHVCCAGSRLLVEESILDTFVNKLKKRIDQIRVGNPLDKNTDMGAINSEAEYNKIKNIVETSRKEGLEYFESHKQDIPEKGFFLKPCFFKGVSNSHLIMRKEIFGPVLGISTFRTPQEAIQKANDTHYGLAAGLWSEKASKIQKVSGELKAGVIWANTYNKFDPASPFGGYFESGMGREGGLHGLLAYVEVQ